MNYVPVNQPINLNFPIKSHYIGTLYHKLPLLSFLIFGTVQTFHVYYLNHGCYHVRTLALSLNLLTELVMSRGRGCFGVRPI
jgi:hypothetical protein